MKLLATSKSEQNLALIDPWTLVHAGAGLAVGLMGFSYGAALTGAVAYELLEAPLERAEFGKNLFNVSKPETPGNQGIDVAIFMLAVAAGRSWNNTE
tara:strand:- start:39 stop:329 length:291 start_codon:yes stop_codon:yes gene_type:complete